MSIWKIDKFIVNSWGQKEGVDLWQVKVWLVRLIPKSYQDILAAVTQDMKRHSPVYKKIKYNAPQDPHMLEISLFDAHFGKLAIESESGDDYSLTIAKTIFSKCVEDLLQKSSAYNIEKIIFPLGNDFFHIDNFNNTTARGTAVDTDGKMAKIFKTGVSSIVSAIDKCANVAPVEVMWIPGNHDAASSYYLSLVINAWYNQCPNVTVDTEEAPRKYCKYGINLIGFTHGHQANHRDLPILMAQECGDVWSQVKVKEWHIGHLHKRMQRSFISLDTHAGIQVRVLPSISGTDAWHYANGFVGSARAGEAHLWSKKDGYAGYLPSNVGL